MAAYEMDFMYLYGIVAYINGVEVFRDNMASGAVSASSVATGSYQTLEYHAVVRPSYEAASAQSVLAVELHFLTATTASAVDFNAFVALIAPSTTDSNCYVYGADFTLTASGGTNVANAFDWGKNSYYEASSSYPARDADARAERSEPLLQRHPHLAGCRHGRGAQGLRAAGHGLLLLVLERHHHGDICILHLLHLHDVQLRLQR